MELVPFKSMISERFGAANENPILEYQVPKGKAGFIRDPTRSLVKHEKHESRKS